MAKICFRTFGCAANFSDSEIMQGLLKKAKFEIIRNMDEAFCAVINICTVKGNHTALKAVREIREKYPYKKIVVAGCITPDIAPEIRKAAHEASLVSTHNIREIVQVVEETINNNPIEVIAQPEKQEPKICLPRVRRNRAIGIVPISSGCPGKCAYCSVKNVKGGLFSYPEEMILEEARRAVTQGCREIWVTAQDTAAYGLDIGKKAALPGLIQKIAKIPGDFRIRVGMMNPAQVLPMTGEMVRAFQNDKVFKFLHMPIQSGNDWMLRQMGRRYSTKQFREIVDAFRAQIPMITVATDIICGFPGETKIQFKESIDFITEVIKPDILNISRFRARPGTEAAAMENQNTGAEARERSRAAASLFEWSAFRNNKRWVGWSGEVIIDEKGKDNTMIGRNFAYRPIVLQEKLRIGDSAKAKIVSTTIYDLRGILI